MAKYPAFDDHHACVCREAKFAAIKMHDNCCGWAHDEDGMWQTDCGGMFVIDSGNPEENDMRFCCYCGRPMKTPNVEVTGSPASSPQGPCGPQG